MPQHYPFSAVVGSDDMALALTLSTISPAIGGVLVRGEKGTAKSTMVRALASILPPIDVIAGDRFSSDPREARPLSPDGPFAPDADVETRPVRLVELPVGATEDRVLGSLHLEKALSEGVTEYEPGLLARAHRGILYVDEVNLLHDHLVDLLLDAAAMGRSTVERDGVSVEHAARFVLVGTMNPEEGELRPQLLDRFGLTVEVAAPRDPATRVEVVRRRLAYETDPDAFAARFADDEASLTDRIQAAQKLVEQVDLSDWALLKIAEVCAAFEVDGMRADIVTARAASAHAAWNGRTAVTRDDIRAAARLALPHRRRRNPFDAPGIDEDLLDRILGDDEPEPPVPDGDGEAEADEDAGPDVSADTPSASPSERQGHGEGEPQAQNPTPPQAASDQAQGEADSSAGEADSSADQTAGGTEDVTVASAQQPYRPKLFTVGGTGAGESGRRSRAITETGRRIGAAPRTGQGGSIHLTETIRAAAPHQLARGRATGSGGLDFRASDLRLAIKEGHESNLILFCVDASGSMAARRRMEQVKTAILSLLMDAYQRRDKVGLITFRADGADLALPPTGSIDIAAARLADLPAGGRTPLAEALLKTADVLRLERVRDPRRRPLLVVITDGRATYGDRALERAHQVAAHLGATGVASLVIDCETGKFKMGLALQLADHLMAEYVPLGEVSASALTEVVKGAA
ncbi:magnesium chelatase subunit D family protein [Aeromicrobium fastidiosum]|uniref:Mg-protoporphyrin IX chelatase n=1 Tax=Aeromicrobium fastidiosum TaxID=52699 RepID=A0A641API5_9ACTN|nr:magnesium chelatase subunit D family protein [Aeromicrobium fastidiosum]KAA1380016.1 magnesium chelatase subunit D family protein [Aeromicrobium fastidiosum]MBP2389539.1 magnesium chelatase subunit D [Aeromicrobium fastidiosum]